MKKYPEFDEPIRARETVYSNNHYRRTVDPKVMGLNPSWNSIFLEFNFPEFQVFAWKVNISYYLRSSF